MKRNIKGLRDALFDTLEKLNDKDNPLDLDRARTICSVATAITNTAKVEVQFMKETGAALESEFIASDEKRAYSKRSIDRTESRSLANLFRKPL
jgi:hypothetical protein